MLFGVPIGSVTSARVTSCLSEGGLVLASGHKTVESLYYSKCLLIKSINVAKPLCPFTPASVLIKSNGTLER